MPRVAEQRSEAGWRVEAGQAQPVDRAVAPHQRGGMGVPNERIVLDATPHLLNLGRAGRGEPGLTSRRPCLWRRPSVRRTPWCPPLASRSSSLGPLLGRMRERLSRPLLVLTLFGAACAHEAAAGHKWVHKLSFAGVHQIDEGELRDVLATEPTGWWPFASKKWLDQAALDLDLERIKAFYAHRGFLDAP